ncbi:spore germination protein [Cohnella herbarum]|uniref:Spore germination protein n=1 Tax=Cohnella herbarum TaxID=2728023 RepID=A0A7Z2VH75_9BACL|nr:spore germination protein [Cohnella herbarum]QJD82829.1 spore germination protein [Cohnella herbarum]
MRKSLDDREETSASSPLSIKLEENSRELAERFADCSDLEMSGWSYGPRMEQKALTVCFDTLVKPVRKNELRISLQNLVAHRLGPAESVTVEDVVRHYERHGISESGADLIARFDQAAQAVLGGKVLVLFDGWNMALAYPALDVEQRQTSEPINEPSVQGSHASTIESLDRNVGVIRNLLQSSNLKFEFRTAGAESRRKIAYGYLDGYVKPEILLEFKKRISAIDQEEILDATYLEDWVGETRYSPFPLARYTERPDTAVAALLDGKIIALVNGSPSILICPGTFMEFFVASDDYYYRPVFSSLIRVLRVAAFIIALMLPSTYIALSTFHSELIPTVLLLAILNTREGIPFPAFVEALIMEFFFELLREAGIRLPRPIGSAVSIVGALVIGQAAIQSQIASPVMVIVVALTGIASFAFPQYNMAIAIRILRFPLMLLAATFGGLGIMVGFLLIYLHLAVLRPLGQPYLASISPLDLAGLRDALFVLPKRLLPQTPGDRRMRHRRAGRGKER